MEGIAQWLQTNWVWLGPITLPVIGAVGWLLNRRITRASRRVDEVSRTLTTLETALGAVREELGNWIVRYGVRGQAIKEATPDQGVAVFRREQELLEAMSQRTRKDV